MADLQINPPQKKTHQNGKIALLGVFFYPWVPIPRETQTIPICDAISQFTVGDLIRCTGEPADSIPQSECQD